MAEKPRPGDDRPIGLGGGEHFGVQYEVLGMLLLNSVALSLSASMTLVACAIVFKWNVVQRSANHATMWMIFLSIGLWSLTKLALTFMILSSTPHERPRRGQPPPISQVQIRYFTLLCEVFFNATSMWIILSTYEFQRWVWRRRIDSRNVMLRYNIFVQGISITHIAIVIIADALNSTPPPGPNQTRPRNGSRGDRPPPQGSSLTPGAMPSPGGHEEREHRNPKHSVQLIETIFWITYFIRWLAVMYPIAIGMVLSFKRQQHSFRGSKSAQLFVGLFIFLNVPCLVLEPLFDFGVIDKISALLLYSLSKCLTYFLGIGMALILGLYLVDFDRLYTPKSERSSETQVRTPILEINHN